MRVLLDAKSVISEGGTFSFPERGIIEMSEPVSIRNVSLEFLS